MMTLLILFFDFVHFSSMVGLIIKLSKERIGTLVYLIKILKLNQNIGIKGVFKILIKLILESLFIPFLPSLLAWK